jgi:predicted CXXCH cytochrome family protein
MIARHSQIFLVLAALGLLGWPVRAEVVDSKHNLSVRGAGKRLAFGENDVCVPCHTPHTVDPMRPIWDQTLSIRTYTLYTSSTMTAVPGQPTGSSKMCLSCHDGTIALANLPGEIHLGMIPAGRANLETDLSDDHPISFRYDFSLAIDNPELVDPLALNPDLRLDEDGQMQCTTCHEPHESRNPDFLVMNNVFSALCLECHRPAGWRGSAHESSVARWNGIGVNPWPYSTWKTVAQNGCYSCHTSHSAGYHERLLTFETEEENCLSCHNGNVARDDIASELQKRSTHPVQTYYREHDPTEEFQSMVRHVECQDCHDPHAAVEVRATAPFANGAISNVPGVTSQGTPIERAQFEYEVCFRCHVSDTQVTVSRVVLEPNIRLKFDSSSPSAHPVVEPTRRRSSPSLVNPWNERLYLYCVDCHANDQGPGAGGNGPAGPHASSWPFLLEREYTVTDGATEA